ncbi:MAG: GGDEF domain-containing protein [Synergistaceae bacterium]|jgi:diguanylate cyclase (GGDEF)-like protein|nr:GGDEF domain-containing protein [Synergistaceae bacterium]
MRRAPLFLCLFYFLSLFVSPAFSDEGNRFLKVSEVEFLLLSDRTRGEVETAERYGGDFRPVPEGTVYFRDFNKLLWLRVPASGLKAMVNALAGRRAVLVLTSEQALQIEFFLPLASGGYRRLSSWFAPDAGRSPPRQMPAFPLEDAEETAETGYAYMCVRTAMPAVFSLFVWEEDALHEHSFLRLRRYMAFSSFMIAWAVTYFFFYAITRDRHYLITFVRQLSACVFLFAFRGDIPPYSAFSPRFVYAVAWGALGLHCVMASLFCRELLQADAQRRGVRLALFHVTMGILITLSAALMYPLLTLFLTGAALIVYVVSSMAVGVMKFRRGYRLMIFFMLSCLSFSAALICLALNTVWALPWSEYAFMSAFLLDPFFVACMLIPKSRERFENYLYMGKKVVRYEKFSQRDDATGLFNKAHILRLLDEQMLLARDGVRDLAFMLLDIDSFKQFNDVWGHPEGDRMVIFLSNIIRHCLRVSDTASRYGGEEFAVILPGGTLPTSILVAERIRRTVERESAMQSEGKRITLSIGLAFFVAGDTTASLVQRASNALLRARAGGGNRTEFGGDV